MNNEPRLVQAEDNHIIYVGAFMGANVWLEIPKEMKVRDEEWRELFNAAVLRQYKDQ